MAAELEPGDPDEDQRVIRRLFAGAGERLVGLLVEGRIGRLANPLEERQAEVTERRGVVRVGGESVAKGGDLLGRRCVAGGR